MSFHICLTLVIGGVSLTRFCVFKKNIGKQWEVKGGKIMKLVVLGMNVVAMARHGPILKDNEATGSRKVLKYLTGHRDGKQKSKIAAKVQ